MEHDVAGVIGRSGGSNRLSAAMHALSGTARKDRHGPKRHTATSRLKDLYALYRFHRGNLRFLHAKIREMRKVKDENQAATQREARHQAALLVQLGAAIDRLEMDARDEEPNPFDQFLQRGPGDGLAQ